MTQPSLYLAPLGLLLAPVVWSDLRHRRIPNTLALGIGVAGLVAQAARGGARGLGAGLLTAFVVGALLMLVWSRGRLGAGDVKLATAVAVWIDPARLPVYLLATALAGGLASIVCYLLANPAARTQVRANLLQVGSSGPLPAGAPSAAQRPTVPYAVAIALGAVVALVWGA